MSCFLLYNNKSKVKPELINRIDSIVIFNKLKIEDIKNIAKIQLEKIINKLRDKNIIINYSNEVLDWLSKHGTDNEFGARPLKRLIKK